jgi:hypothetical protein
MVWVNPPNRVNYTVINPVRNVHSRMLSEFDATRLQNVQPTASVKVAEISTANAQIENVRRNSDLAMRIVLELSD